MSRAKQRANRRLKHYLEANPSTESEHLAPGEKPWLNSEGYHDPTAYEALRNIQRKERSNLDNFTH